MLLNKYLFSFAFICFSFFHHVIFSSLCLPLPRLSDLEKLQYISDKKNHFIFSLSDGLGKKEASFSLEPHQYYLSNAVVETYNHIKCVDGIGGQQFLNLVICILKYMQSNYSGKKIIGLLNAATKNGFGVPYYYQYHWNAKKYEYDWNVLAYSFEYIDLSAIEFHAWGNDESYVTDDDLKKYIEKYIHLKT
jgi:hypothetical protein